MLTLDEEHHEYRWKDRIIPGVTYLLNKYNLTGYQDVPPHILEPARILGTAVHLATELHDKKALNYSTIAPKVLPYLSAWVSFLKVSGFEALHIEPKLFSPAYGFAGKPDRIGILKGKMTILDIKTPKLYHRATGPQTAGYEILAEENLNLKIKKRYAIMLRPDGRFNPMPCKSAYDTPAFLACVTLERWARNGKAI